MRSETHQTFFTYLNLIKIRSSVSRNEALDLRDKNCWLPLFYTHRPKNKQPSNKPSLQTVDISICHIFQSRNHRDYATASDNRMINECEAVGGMRIGREYRSARRKPAPAALCDPALNSD
jgi:hypothetical protein